MQKGGDNSWFLYLPKYLLFPTLLIYMGQKYSFLCIFLQFFTINRSKMVVVDINRFLFCSYCACASLDPAVRLICFRLEIKKSGPVLFLVLKYVPYP